MRSFMFFIIGLTSCLTACRDREETALERLDELDYGFATAEYQRAAENGDLEAVKTFLDAGMAVDVEGPDGETAFQKAASAKQDEMVKQLIHAGAAPDQRLAEGRTLLMQVAGRTETDLRMLDFLLENHADPKAVDAAGMTALMVAAMSGNVDGVRRLAPLDVRSLDKALMLASASGHTHCLEALIARGAYVNCRSHDSRTPLMYAAGKGHAEAVQLLLTHRANRFAVDEEGRSAADLAETAGHPALATLLRDTSELLATGASPNDELLPDLDGQVLAFHQLPAVEPHSQGAVEPARPLLEKAATEVSTEGIRPDTPVDAPSDPPENLAGAAPETNDSTGTRNIDLSEEIQLGPFKERFEPLLLTEVKGTQATMRLLHRPVEEGLITVMPGQRIPHTNYEVTQVTKRIRPAKGGGTVDVSEVRVRDPQRQSEQRFVLGTLPRAQETHLVIEARRSEKQFAARLGDVFTIAETQEQYTVTDVRPHQLLLRNDSTSDVVTIQRR